MLSYFSRVPFTLAHCVTDTMYLPVIKNIDILINLLLFLFIYVFIFYFLKLIISICFEDHIGNKCSSVCFKDAF